jgi:hypothetical protein
MSRGFVNEDTQPVTEVAGPKDFRSVTSLIGESATPVAEGDIIGGRIVIKVVQDEGRWHYRLQDADTS